MIRTIKNAYLFGFGVSFLAVAYFVAITLKTGNILVSATIFAMAGSGVTSFILCHLVYRYRWLGLVTSIALGLFAGIAILTFGLLGLFFEIHFLGPDFASFFYGTIFSALLKGFAFKKIFIVLNGLHLLSVTTLFSLVFAAYAKRKLKVAERKGLGAQGE